MELSLKEIVVEDRGRKDFKNIPDLAESIKQYGLIHPIVVGKREDGKYDLVAGERRFRAAILAGWSKVPVTLREELSPIEAKEIELEENIQRSDLSWVEENEILAQLHALKKSRNNSDPEKGDWRQKDTAELVGMDSGLVGKRLKLNEEMAKNPGLKEKVSRLPLNAAMKYVKQEKERERVKRLYESKKSSREEMLDFHLGDFREHAPKIEDNSIGLVLTDPPFGIENIETKRESSSQKLMNYKQGIEDGDNLTIEEARVVYEALFKTMARVLKPGAHFYVFFAMDLYDHLRYLVDENELGCQASPLIWYKERAMTPFMGYDYSSCYEPILYGWKPPRDRRLAEPAKTVLSFKPISGDKLHNFEKPQDLLRFLIKQSSYLGEPVYDPFAGSGSTLLAAIEAGRVPVGAELSDKHYYTARERIIGGKRVPEGTSEGV